MSALRNRLIEAAAAAIIKQHDMAGPYVGHFRFTGESSEIMVDGDLYLPPIVDAILDALAMNRLRHQLARPRGALLEYITIAREAS